MTPCKSSAPRSAPQWTFLSDPGRTVQQDLDIAEYTDPEHNPMIPSHPATMSTSERRKP